MGNQISFQSKVGPLSAAGELSNSSKIETRAPLAVVQAFCVVSVKFAEDMPESPNALIS